MVDDAVATIPAGPGPTELFEEELDSDKDIATPCMELACGMADNVCMV